MADCEAPKKYTIKIANAVSQRETFDAYACVRVLTVVALGACVRGHGTVTGVVLPLLNADAHVCTGVLLTRSTRT